MISICQIARDLGSAKVYLKNVLVIKLGVDMDF